MLKRLLFFSVLITSLSFPIVSYSGEYWHLTASDGREVTKYMKDDGEFIVNDWFYDGHWWHFFDEKGNEVKDAWVDWNGKSYYLNFNGIMERNTITPDGYYVGDDGAWIPSGLEEEGTAIIDIIYASLVDSVKDTENIHTDIVKEDKNTIGMHIHVNFGDEYAAYKTIAVETAVSQTESTFKGFALRHRLSYLPTFKLNAYYYYGNELITTKSF